MKIGMILIALLFLGSCDVSEEYGKKAGPVISKDQKDLPVLIEIGEMKGVKVAVIRNEHGIQVLIDNSPCLKAGDSCFIDRCLGEKLGFRKVPQEGLLWLRTNPSPQGLT